MQSTSSLHDVSSQVSNEAVAMEEDVGSLGSLWGPNSTISSYGGNQAEADEEVDRLLLPLRKLALPGRAPVLLDLEDLETLKQSEGGSEVSHLSQVSGLLLIQGCVPGIRGKPFP
jgi:hypothetical protein